MILSALSLVAVASEEPSWQQLSASYEEDADEAAVRLAQGCNVRRADAAAFVAEELRSQEGDAPVFPSDYPQPLLLTNIHAVSCGCGPRCVEDWRRYSFLQRFGHLPVSSATGATVAAFGPNTEPFPRALSEVVAEMGANGSQIAFDSSEKLLRDIRQGTPGWGCTGRDGERGAWPEFLRQFPGIQALSLGPMDAGLPLHDHEAAVLWLVHGRKRWYLFPPGEASEEDLIAGHGVSTLAWAKHSAQRPPRAAPPLQCTQLPGELMFVPRRWHHATLNLETALGFGGQAERLKMDLCARF